MTGDSSNRTRRSLLRAMGAASGVTLAATSFAGTAAASDPTHCPKTPGYWMTHFPEGWPRYVTGENEGELGRITVAGVTYDDHEELAGWLWAPPRGDKTVIMAKHLIATKLNRWVAPRPWKTFCPAVAALFPDGEQSAPDAWLEEHGIGGGVDHWGTFEWRDETYDVEHDIKDVLVDYNEGRLCECADDGKPGGHGNGNGGPPAWSGRERRR